MDSTIPDVSDTDLDRDDLEEAAEEIGLEGYEDLDDQELFEHLGRHLGELDDVEVGDDEGEGSGRSAASSADVSAEEVRRELEEWTRDELRDELRGLQLPVAGTKQELLDRLQAARVTERRLDAEDPSGQAADEVSADDEDEPREPAEADTDAASTDSAPASADTDEDESEATGGRALDIGPKRFDLLGLEVRLGPVHADLVANPEGRLDLLGRLLARHWPDENGGALSRVAGAVTQRLGSAKHAVTDTAGATRRAAGAAKDAVTPGGKVKAAGKATKAASDAKDATEEAGEVITGKV